MYTEQNTNQNNYKNYSFINLLPSNPQRVPPGTIVNSNPAHSTAPNAIDGNNASSWFLAAPVANLQLNFPQVQNISKIHLIVSAFTPFPSQMEISIWGQKTSGGWEQISSSSPPVFIFPGTPQQLQPIETVRDDYKGIEIKCHDNFPAGINEVYIS